MEIIKKDNNKEIIQELRAFDYYTLPRFIADMSKQFSSLWIFIFVQVLFIEVPELVTENSKAMMQAYWGIIELSLLICLSSFILCTSFSVAIISTSLTKNRHIKYILKIRKSLIKRAKNEISL